MNLNAARLHQRPYYAGNYDISHVLDNLAKIAAQRSGEKRKFLHWLDRSQRGKRICVKFTQKPPEPDGESMATEGMRSYL